VAAATTAHSLFPPQPGAVALINAYRADTGMVYIYGIIVAIPSVICAGLILPRFLSSECHRQPLISYPRYNLIWTSGSPLPDVMSKTFRYFFATTNISIANRIL
jgi:H+/gluconate symporter-like permease